MPAVKLSVLTIADRTLRFCSVDEDKKFYNTSDVRKDGCQPLFLGSDVLSGLPQGGKNISRLHARFAKQGLATRLLFKGCRIDSLRKGDDAYFYSIYGLFVAVFQYHSLEVQHQVLQLLTDTWIKNFTTKFHWQLDASYNVSTHNLVLSHESFPSGHADLDTNVMTNQDKAASKSVLQREASGQEIASNNLLSSSRNEMCITDSAVSTTVVKDVEHDVGSVSRVSCREQGSQTEVSWTYGSQCEESMPWFTCKMCGIRTRMIERQKAEVEAMCVSSTSSDSQLSGQQPVKKRKRSCDNFRKDRTTAVTNSVDLSKSDRISTVERTADSNVSGETDSTAKTADSNVSVKVGTVVNAVDLSVDGKIGMVANRTDLSVDGKIGMVTNRADLSVDGKIGMVAKIADLSVDGKIGMVANRADLSVDGKIGMVANRADLSADGKIGMVANRADLSVDGKIGMVANRADLSADGKIVTVASIGDHSLSGKTGNAANTDDSSVGVKIGTVANTGSQSESSQSKSNRTGPIVTVADRSVSNRTGCIANTANLSVDDKIGIIGNTVDQIIGRKTAKANMDDINESNRTVVVANMVNLSVSERTISAANIANMRVNRTYALANTADLSLCEKTVAETSTADFSVDNQTTAVLHMGDLAGQQSDNTSSDSEHLPAIFYSQQSGELGLVEGTNSPHHQQPGGEIHIEIFHVESSCDETEEHSFDEGLPSLKISSTIDDGHFERLPEGDTHDLCRLSSVHSVHQESDQLVKEQNLYRVENIAQTVMGDTLPLEIVQNSSCHSQVPLMSVQNVDSIESKPSLPEALPEAMEAVSAINNASRTDDDIEDFDSCLRPDMIEDDYAAIVDDSDLVDMVSPDDFLNDLRTDIDNCILRWIREVKWLLSLQKTNPAGITCAETVHEKNTQSSKIQLEYVLLVLEFLKGSLKFVQDSSDVLTVADLLMLIHRSMEKKTDFSSIFQEWLVPGMPPLKYCLLTTVAQWIGEEFHGFEEVISERVTEFKEKHISHIRDLPSATETINELFPPCMVVLVSAWIGLTDLQKMTAAAQDHSYEGRGQVVQHQNLNLYPLIQLILELLNNCLVSGIAHVVYCKLRHAP